jgi:hypothetical protein
MINLQSKVNDFLMTNSALVSFVVFFILVMFFPLFPIRTIIFGCGYLFYFSYLVKSWGKNSKN